MKNKTIHIILVIGLIILVSIFVIVNINGFDINETDLNAPITTTKRMGEDITGDKRVVRIVIEGEDTEMYVRSYSSHLGFKVDYDVDNFNATHLSKGAVVLTNIYDSNIYIEIEKLSQDEYFEQYENMEKEVIKGDYINSYKFYRGDNLYLKITKSIKNNHEYEGLNIRMDYMINSITLN